MTTHDLAAFERWLEFDASPEERELPYEKQIEAHILWLAGFNGEPILEQIPPDALGEAN